VIRVGPLVYFGDLGCNVNILNAIWYVGNSATFNNKKVLWKYSIAKIISNFSITASKANMPASSSISEFIILKAFKEIIHPRKANIIKEVF